ncbi:50S ribosomal protein L7/L12 [Striga asiatica]|uniref:50S ribosomal protein L7/L12 n=1 Tax=Striga asiatica TaxID=4170 RepID=A0A5A7Q342_STRAF|nr:50S ribosomal protein L7/L12 [Striga asiatica]
MRAKAEGARGVDEGWTACACGGCSGADAKVGWNDVRGSTSGYERDAKTGVTHKALVEQGCDGEGAGTLMGRVDRVDKPSRCRHALEVKGSTRSAGDNARDAREMIGASPRGIRHSAPTEENPRDLRRKAIDACDAWGAGGGRDLEGQGLAMTTRVEAREGARSF